jgi:hypothetical protein
MAFVGPKGHTANILLLAPGRRKPATARKAKDQSRALMVGADAVLAQEVAPSGTLCLWRALVLHAQAAQRDDGPMMLSRAAPEPVRACVDSSR